MLILARHVNLLGLCTAALLFTLFLRPSHAQDESVLAYAVGLEMRSWRGNGIYIGKGLILTAAHVVGRTWLSKPMVVIGGQKYPTRTVKEGESEGTDLTLLAVDQGLLPMRLQLRQNKLCSTPPWPGQEVVTIVPEAAVHSYVLAPEQLPRDVRRFNTVIRDVATTGNSGSGVFDARQRCLLGIVSKKISQSRIRTGTGQTEVHDIAKYFVPASVIAEFMPAEFRSLITQ